MIDNLVPDGIEKVLTNQYLRWLDTTPSANAETWDIIGVGVEDGNGGTEYNPNIERKKWIIEKSARSNQTSNDKQASFPQETYKGDPVFEFVNAGRDKLNYTSHVLEVDTWNGTSGTYPAKRSDCSIAVTSYDGNEIDWDLYFDGDPVEGTVVITNGKPVFTPTTSL